MSNSINLLLSHYYFYLDTQWCLESSSPLVCCWLSSSLTCQVPSPLTCKSLLALLPQLSHLSPPQLSHLSSPLPSHARSVTPHAHSPRRRSTGVGGAGDRGGGPECHPDVPDLLQSPPIPHHLALLGGGAPGWQHHAFPRPVQRHQHQVRKTVWAQGSRSVRAN